MISNFVDPIGAITAFIEYADKRPLKILSFPNVVLNKGRETLANFLVGSVKSVFIKRMLFGDGGFDSQHSVKKDVYSENNNLYGITRVNKPVVAQIDPMVPTQAIFTAVITFEEANGHTLNEMALQLSDENLFSMATFPDLGKTNQIQITWNWRINII